MTAPLTDRPRARARRDVLGASEVAEALGLSPFRDASPMRVWRRKQPDHEPAAETEVQARGHLLERACLEWYEDDQGVTVHPVADAEWPLIGPEPWMGATPDGLVLVQQAPAWLVEAKTTRTGWVREGEHAELPDAHAWGTPGTDAIPLHYAVQCAWQLAVCDLDRVDVVVHGPYLDDWHVYTVRRDRDVERRLVDAARAWWERHVVGGEPPPLDASPATRDYLLSRWPRPTSTRRPATVAETELALDLRAVRRERQAAVRREAEIRAALEASIGNASGITGEWGRIDWTATKGQSRIDVKRLRAEEPTIAARFTVRGEDGRTFTPRFKNDEE